MATSVYKIMNILELNFYARWQNMSSVISNLLVNQTRKIQSLFYFLKIAQHVRIIILLSFLTHYFNCFSDRKNKISIDYFYYNYRVIGIKRLFLIQSVEICIGTLLVPQLWKILFILWRKAFLCIFTSQCIFCQMFLFWNENK